MASLIRLQSSPSFKLELVMSPNQPLLPKHPLLIPLRTNTLQFRQILLPVACENILCIIRVVLIDVRMMSPHLLRKRSGPGSDVCAVFADCGVRGGVGVAECE